MKKIDTLKGAILLLLVLCVSCEKTKKTEIPQSPKILIVFSGTTTDPWTEIVNKGINSVLKGKGVEFGTIYMNLTKSTPENEKITAGNNVKKKFEQYKPFIVIASDDDAQQYFAKDLATREDVQVVFCGVEQNPSIYNYPVDNVTGIIEKTPIQMVIKTLEKLKKSVSPYTILTDNTQESALFIRYIKGMNLGINIQSIDQVAAFADWKNKITSINTGVLVTYGFNLSDASEKEVSRWTAENITIPSIAFSREAVKAGLLIGAVDSGLEHGELAATYALELLKGKKAKQLIIRPGQKGFTFINEKTAQKFNINRDDFINIVDDVY